MRQLYIIRDWKEAQCSSTIHVLREIKFALELIYIIQAHIVFRIHI